MNLLSISNVSSCSFLLLCLGKPLFANDSIIPCATQGCSFWWHIFVCPPWAAWNRYSWNHWNRATIYAETKHVLEQLSEICALKCGLKIAKTQRPRGNQPAKPALVLCLKKQPLLLFSYAKHLKDTAILDSWKVIYMVISSIRLEWENRTGELKNKFTL